MHHDKTNEEPEVLDAATVEAIQLGLASEENGHFLTLEQAVQFAKQRREAWQTVPQATA